MVLEFLVDEDTFLHMETDPRYRGSVIPSRAFRMLQNMTDSGQGKDYFILIHLHRILYEYTLHLPFTATISYLCIFLNFQLPLIM